MAAATNPTAQTAVIDQPSQVVTAPIAARTAGHRQRGEEWSVRAQEGRREEGSHDHAAPGIRHSLAPERSGRLDREASHSGEDQCGRGEGRGGPELFAHGMEDCGGPKEQQGGHDGQTKDEQAAFAAGKEGVCRGEEEGGGGTDRRDRAVRCRPRGEPGLDEIRDGLDDVVVDLLAHRSRLQQEDGTILNPLCGKGFRHVEWMPVSAEEAVPPARGAGIEDAQLAREIGHQFSDRKRRRHPQIGLASL